MIRRSAPPEVASLVNFIAAGFAERNPKNQHAFDALAGLLVAMIQHESGCTDAEAHRTLAQTFHEIADALADDEEDSATIKH